MVINGIFKWVYDIGNWLAKMMYLHFLWVIFTLLGLVAFGFMPATTALFSVLRKWIEEDPNIPLFKHFYTSYKTHFLKSNALGIIIIGLGLFLYFDITISKQLIQSSYVHIILLLLCFFYFVTLLYFFPVFVRYKLKSFVYYKQSFFLALARPFETIAMIISLLLVYYLFSYLPILLLFVGSPLIAYPLMWFSYRACLQIEEKKLIQKN